MKAGPDRPQVGELHGRRSSMIAMLSTMQMVPAGSKPFCDNNKPSGLSENREAIIAPPPLKLRMVSRTRR
ncbi:MAG: hypothetical protein QUV05_02195 [Phycisphaerae bacterium]|nr:hypothetical protein [Phycisphaerae bacterium]